MKHYIKVIVGLLIALFIVVGCGGQEKVDHKGSSTSTSTVQQTEQGNQNKKEAQGPNGVADNSTVAVEEGRTYTDKDHVAAYVHRYKKLPSNYITKKEAEALGWKEKGSLDKVAPGKSIGGDRYGNYEKQVPSENGRSWKEADIDYVKGNRGPKRIVYSNDGLIYYTEDHYKTFVKLY